MVQILDDRSFLSTLKSGAPRHIYLRVNVRAGAYHALRPLVEAEL